MKIVLSYLTVITLTAACFVACGQKTDPVKTAESANEKKADDNKINEDVAEFLVKSADARMMDLQEGKLASAKGTTPAIREYGDLMMKDQAMLLEKIKILAKERNISLPSSISNKKAEGREDLAEKGEEDFDKKFIKMMKIDHERDVKLFREATEFEDRGVQEFARQYLPMIQSHLDKIIMIKETPGR